MLCFYPGRFLWYGFYAQQKGAFIVSHLHFPDGVLPLWLVGLGIGLTILIIALISAKLKGEGEGDLARKTSTLAVISALMIVAMSIPMGFIHYHINLTVLVALLAGPWLAFLSVFVVNFLLSLIGHGGITVVGLNTLVLGSEVFLAAMFFPVFRRLFKPLIAVFTTTLSVLILSNVFAAFIIFLSTLSLETVEVTAYVEAGQQLMAGIPGWLLGSILVMVLVGGTIEAGVIAFILSYLRRVRPELVKNIFGEKDEAA